MNAAQEFNLQICVQVYNIINDVMKEDYDAWCQMSEETLLNEVLRRAKGRCNPHHVREVINNL